MMKRSIVSTYLNNQRFCKRWLSTVGSRSRLGIGCSKLSLLQQDGLQSSVIATALQNGGIDLFECGHDKKSEESLARAFVDAVMYLKDNGGVPKSDITVTSRIGYRSLDEQDQHESDENRLYPSDVLVEDESTRVGGDSQNMKVYHNISQEYISSVIDKSPIIDTMKDHANVNLVYLLHNPEAQSVEYTRKGVPLEDARHKVRERLTDSFIQMERYVAEQAIGSYGVCSNGLTLPESHPLHLNWKDVLLAAGDAVRQVHGHDFQGEAAISTIQLPINLLETSGLNVATHVKQFLASSIDKQTQRLPKDIHIHATRPLTCYPDGGTGTGFPFNLIDHRIPTSLRDSTAPKQWTHDIEGSVPSFYHSILSETMRYFDATHLLEASEEGRKLTVEERETLDGCRLIQSMIHDLDAYLSSGKIRSFAQYEQDILYNSVGMIHDNFAELDEGSSNMLQLFFQGYGFTMRHSIARTTRDLLQSGDEGGSKYDICNHQSLQEFALQHLLRQRIMHGRDCSETVLVDRIMVGCSQPEHVVDAIQAADHFDSLKHS